MTVILGEDDVAYYERSREVTYANEWLPTIILSILCLAVKFFSL